MKLHVNSSATLRYVFLVVSSLPIGACGIEGSDGPQSGPDDRVAELSQGLTGTWRPLTNPPPANLDTCLLLTTGSAMCHEYNSNRWHRLTPDSFGSYQNGTWDTPAIAPMPNGNDPHSGCANCTYAPLYFASAVLPDGRAVVIGGEYNSLTPVWTNIGFIYDPVANTWSSQLGDVFGGGNVGDAQGMVLPNGNFVVTNILTTDMESLNPATGAFTALHPTGKLDINDEENWTPLYDGTVLTVDSRTVSSFERYTPFTNTWGGAGATPVNLADTGGGSVGNSEEVGPCLGRPDNKIMCFSGNALGQNALYDPSTNTWSHTASMDFPVATGGHFAMADGASAALPNGNILVMASPVTPTSPFSAPSHFYELDLNNNLSAVTDSPHAASFAAYQGRMLMLPTGEVLLTAFNQASIQDVMLYSNGGSPAAGSRPTITSTLPTLVANGTYSITGRLFNGYSEGTSYGDDTQSATNYPLVRITSNATGRVFYARTFNHSRRGVEATGSTSSVTTSFQVPADFDNGTASLAVVANGITSPLKAANKCVVGAPYRPAPDATVSLICSVDPLCCNTTWDAICINENRTIGGSLQCLDPVDTCAHSLCFTGGPLASGCDSVTSNCVATICAADPFCCNVAWDAECMAEISSGACGPGKNCN
jgi:hypothetical protein